MESTSVPLIEVQDLSIAYPDFRMGPLTFSLAAGERVALVGKNGAGKSSTLKALGGRVVEYEGRILREGRELRSLVPGVRSRIGFLPERFCGYGWMTVEEHLRFLSAFYPTWDREYEEELVERFDLSRRSRIGTLSKGTKVKLSFVAAEAYRPRVLLLDEPTSGIDPVMRRELLDVLRSCAPAGGERLLVFSSHILEDITSVCDRILLLSEGRLLENADRRELESRCPGGSLSEALYRRLSRSE